MTDSLKLATDIHTSRANPAKAARELGWHARLDLPQVVRQMLDAPAA